MNSATWIMHVIRSNCNLCHCTITQSGVMLIWKRGAKSPLERSKLNHDKKKTQLSRRYSVYKYIFLWLTSPYRKKPRFAKNWRYKIIQKNSRIYCYALSNSRNYMFWRATGKNCRSPWLDSIQFSFFFSSDAGKRSSSFWF